MRSFVELQSSSTWSRSLLERSRNSRGSRRLTRNQTENEWHETTIRPIREYYTPGSHWKSTIRHQYARVVCTVFAAEAWDVFPGKRRWARGRTILFLGKQYCHYRIQERDLSCKEGKFFLYRSPTRSSVRNGFWEIPLDRRRFPSLEPVLLMMWVCPLSRHNRHKQRVRVGTVCIWEQILWESPMSCCLDKQEKRLGKRKRKYFSFLFSALLSV